MIRDIQKEILTIKQERDICILAHCYQNPEILEVADFVGDSYSLALKASKVPNRTVLMCGVRFMAEMVKILSPDKQVILSHSDAGCPMAEQLDKEMVLQVREKLPDYTIVAYINTTLELKTVCDVCVTSSSAVRICRKIDHDNILFLPDPQLGSWVAGQIPEKQFRFLGAGCPTHYRITVEDLKKVKNKHPDALVAVHPECRPEVVAAADYVGSTTGIMDFARESKTEEFIIGTENSIVSHLELEYPNKRFYPLSKECICPNMRLTTLVDVRNCCFGVAGEEICIEEKVRIQAKKCLDEMIRLGN